MIFIDHPLLYSALCPPGSGAQPDSTSAAHYTALRSGSHH